jgi:hypothetical protein
MASDAQKRPCFASDSVVQRQSAGIVRSAAQIAKRRLGVRQLQHQASGQKRRET